MKNIIKSLHICLLVFLLLLISLACQFSDLTKKEPTKTPLSPTQTATLFPTFTPIPLGSKDNPYIIATVASSENLEEAELALKGLATYISDNSEQAFLAKIYPDYQSLLFDLQKRKIHFAWLPPIPYIVANRNSAALPVVLINSFGVYFYGIQFFADRDSDFEVFYNEASGESTASAEDALAQFADQTPCWVDPDSLSGYIIPIGLLNDQEIEISDGVFAHSASAVIRSLYIKGICNFGVTYAYTGDPRTASSLSDLPDVQERIVIIWKSDPIIPMMNLSAYPDLDSRLVQQVGEILTAYSHQQEGKDLISQATGSSVEGVKPINDASYEPLRHYINAAGIDIQQLIDK
jgi:phosphonate transport system substrate-binding protein